MLPRQQTIPFPVAPVGIARGGYALPGDGSGGAHGGLGQLVAQAFGRDKPVRQVAARPGDRIAQSAVKRKAQMQREALHHGGIPLQQLER